MDFLDLKTPLASFNRSSSISACYHWCNAREHTNVTVTIPGTMNLNEYMTVQLTDSKQ
jgi:hypothetical protein